MTKSNIDSYGRKIDYLRISVTDRCNLRCIYCMPNEGIKLVRHEDILRYEEIAKISQIAVDIGIRKIRLTGGEPLVRKGISNLVEMLSSISLVEDISMTTNGIELAKHARSLANAGLNRVNISIDTMKPERFKEITRLGNLSDVWSGIYAAEKVGLTPIKLNVIPMKHINDDEIVDFALLTQSHPWTVRFIELMKFPQNQIMQNLYFISAEEVLERLSSLNIHPIQKSASPGSGPARYYKLPDAIGEIGIISAVTQHFCQRCNRIRLTADGRLRLCLFSEREFNIKKALRSGASDKYLREILQQAIMCKPAEYKSEVKRQKRSMWQIGG